MKKELRFCFLRYILLSLSTVAEVKLVKTNGKASRSSGGVVAMVAFIELSHGWK